MGKKIAETKKRGGKRAGAGRPRVNSDGPAVRVSLSLSAGLLAQVDAIAGVRERSAVASRLLRAGLERDAVAGR